MLGSKLKVYVCVTRSACSLQPGHGANVNACSHASSWGPGASVQRGGPESFTGYVPQPGQGGGPYCPRRTAWQQGCCYQLPVADG